MLNTRRSIAITVAGLGLLCQGLPIDASEPQPTSLKIGPETTVVEGPLREDGTVDYVAALNAILSEGVTPDNNAFVVLAESLPPRWLLLGDDEGLHEQVFEKLGVPQPEGDAVYLQSLSEYASAARHRDERWAEEVQVASENPHTQDRWRWEEGQAHAGPWTAEQLPLVAEWLKAQNQVLDRLSEGYKRERFWAPYMKDPRGWITSPTKGGAGSEFLMRVNYHLGAGDLRSAFADILAIKRQARHFRSLSRVSEQAAAARVASVGSLGVGNLAAHEQLTAEQARTFQAELRKVHGRAPLDRAARLGDRFLDLNAFQDRQDLYADLKLVEGFPEAFKEVFEKYFDQNMAMRRVNTLYDRLARAFNGPSRSDRLRLLRGLQESRSPHVKGNGRYDWTLDWEAFMRELDEADEVERPAVVTRAFTDARLDLFRWLILGIAMDLADRAEVRERLEIAALAVAGYRAEHGQHPESLDVLVPDWLDAVPRDLFLDDEEPIRYRVQADRVVLYSVGPNGEDNGGVDDWREGDVVIEWSR